MKDEYGIKVKVGDVLSSAYGIPGRRILGTVIERDGVLWVLTPGHNPSECTLRQFKKHLGEFEVEK